LAKKGVTRNGEAYCLQCKSSVDPTIERCPSCDSVFEEEEIRTFFCPRCQNLLSLGTPTCPECGMKFRVKSIKHSDSIVDLDEHPPPEEVPAETLADTSEDEQASRGGDLSSEQLGQLQSLVGGITRVAEARSRLLARMAEHADDERDRLASLAGADEGDAGLGVVEAEIVTLSDDMAAIMQLYSDMLSLADDVSSVSESLGLSEEARRKGLAAKAQRIKTDESGVGEEVLRAREEQLARREEMVDRKIKGYALKKREFDDREAELEARLERMKREQALLDEAKGGMASSASESVRANEKAELEREVARRLARMESSLTGDQTPPGEVQDVGVDDMLSSFESHVRKTVEQREETDLRVKELVEGEDEVRRLLRALDQLLGQLPESVIQKFTQSEDYRLYEAVLDRLKI
jgi:RNA polymerase subunit RPABC4/transcription elongation factor Spt4